MAPMDVDEPGAASPPALLTSCNFAIVRSTGLTDAAAQKLVATIKLHGGQAIIDQCRDQNLTLEGLTHIISATSDFPDYDTACDALIPVIKPSWIDASLMKDKLANPRQYNPDPKLFLSDVVVTCADLPEGDADAIAGGVLAMGGLHTSRVTSQVTHIVALTMDSDKCTIVQNKKLNIKIVLPHWFDDCLKLGRRIDERPYLLPDPEILHQFHRKAPSAAHDGNVTGAIYPDPSKTPSPTPPPPARKDLQVFKNKAMMLSTNLGIGVHLREILEGLIVGSGGKLVNNVHKSDMYICKYREGDDYKIASRAGKEVGNLAWLYYLITNNVWTSPMRRLLHYPTARDGLPGFKDLRISLSNYSGDARIYLENLVMAAGAECTKTLKQDNTHLITAHVMSEKCAAAKEWGIHLVNHLWLEESYAKWKIQSVTDSRYTHFPHRTNLGEVVGQTRLDRNALERHFFTSEDTDMEDADELPIPPPRTDRNGPSGQVSQSSMLKSPAVIQTNAKVVRTALSNGKPPKAVLDVRRMSEPDKFRTPTVSRFLATGKENETPSTTASRKSKDLAAAKLQNMTPDIALYEKERKRVGGVVYGGRRKDDQDRIVVGQKRSSDEASDSDETATETNEQKRARKVAPAVSTFAPTPSMHLLISGYKKWVNHPKIEDNEKKQLRNLGIIITQDPSRASHLAAPNILRTHKFVSALAYAPTIISTGFIEACLERDQLPDPKKYILQDEASEKKFGISLAESLDRAKKNRNQLFQGRTFYCVEKIHGGFEIFKSIIEANGGRCNMYRGRPDTMVPSRRADSEGILTDDDAQAEVYLISSIEKEHVKLRDRFRQMAEGSRKVPRVLKSDWLLATAMAQKMLPIEGYEL